MTSRSQDRLDTLIGAGTRVDGDIACTGVLRVQGDILGNVSCRDNPAGTLVVDSAGSVTGAVDAVHVAVRGRLIGPVQSSQSIEIHQGAFLAGDISFRKIAIHAGGVVEGLLNPTLAPDEGSAEGPARAPVPKRPSARELPTATANGSRLMERLGGTRRVGGAVLLAIAAIAIAALSGQLSVITRLADDVSLREIFSLKGSTVPESVTVGGGEVRGDPKAAQANTAAPPPALSVAAPDVAQTPAPVRAANDQNKVVTVTGANPRRPPGVFLLIANEPTVLYRKKRDDATEGDRISVSAGEKISVSIAADDLIRVAQGKDIAIFFQGQKVARTTIEGGAWISFVPK